MRASKFFLTSISALLLPVLIIFFQNCSQQGGFVVEDSLDVLKTVDPYFGYKYKGPTPVYAEFQLSRLSQGQDMSTYEFVGAFTASDGSQDRLDYKVEVFDQNNQIVCPAYESYLQNGPTFVRFSCATWNQNTKLKIKVTTVYKERSSVFTQDYSL